MQYRVRFLSQNPPAVVDATEFHPMGNGVIFYKERMRNTLGNDQWGNPRRMPTRVPVAFMTNIESILEINEEEGPATEGVDPFGVFTDNQVRLAGAHEALQRLGAMNVTPPPVQFNQIHWVDEAGPQMLTTAAPTMDDDGVEWDAQRNE